MIKQSLNYADIEQRTRTFLETLQKQGGLPIYTLSPKDARAVLSNLQASNPVAMLPADIESRTIPGGPWTDIDTYCSTSGKQGKNTSCRNIDS